MPSNRVLCVVLGCLLLLLADATLAKPLQQLQQNGKLRIKTWIEPQENIIARQQVNLQIEVATERWFSSGTRIRHFEIDGAIVLQRDSFAVNSTRREDDTTWTVQLWTLVIYPQRGGVFEIPAIPLWLSVAGEDSQSINGEVSTRPFSFVTTVPESMQDKTGWVATNRFDVSETFNKSFEELKPGDALIRTVTISADNLPSMMLPGISSPAVPGIGVYKKPAQLTDKVNRGDYLAGKTEEITYVFEKPGDYELPGHSFYWWNLRSQSLELLELDAVALQVSGTATVLNVGGEPQPITADESSLDLFAVMKKAITVLAILVLLLIAVRKRQQVSGSGLVVEQTHLSASALRRAFARACRQQDFEKALGLLYRWLDQFGNDRFGGSLRAQIEATGQPELLRGFNDVMYRMYGKNDYNDVDLKQFANAYIKATAHADLHGKKSSERFSRLPKLSVDLRLN